MLIDCEGCALRGLACGDCVVTLLLATDLSVGEGPGEPVDLRVEALRARDPAGGPSGDAVALDRTDRRALHVLADAGLAPRLRHEPRRRTG